MPPAETNAAPLAGKTVQELQALAEQAARRTPARRFRGRLSRAAQLHLIDQLSRWGGSGLAVFAGTTIFVAMLPARDFPVRTTVWAAMVFASLYLCRRYRKEFRRGDHIASKPFRWRAYYASTLAVVSAAFGAGALLLRPPAGIADASQILAVILIAAIAASAFHAAHRASAAAAGGPAFAAVALAALSGFGVSVFTIALVSAGLVSAVLIALLSRESENRAAQRFPRTTFIRRELERDDQRPAAFGAAERAAG